MQPAKSLIDAFEKLTLKHGGPVAWSLSFDSGKPGPHALFSSIIHGNETGSLPAVLGLAEKLSKGKVDFIGRISFILGNVAASLKNERLIEADLNRVFTETGSDSLERRRALELMPFLKTADLFVDFHQTTMPCLEPFFIFAFEERSYLWARYTEAAGVLITRSAKEKFTQNALCIDEYARQFKIPSITIELGQAGLTAEAETATQKILDKVIEGHKKMASGATLEDLAARAPELRFLAITHREPFDDRSAELKPGYVNLGRVQGNELMGKGAKGEYVCPRDGYLLFPKYAKRDEKGLATGPLGGELYMLLEPLDDHPQRLWG